MSNVMDKATADGAVFSVDRHVRHHKYEGMVCTDTPTAGSSLFRIYAALMSNVEDEAATDGTVVNVGRLVRQHEYDGMVK